MVACDTTPSGLVAMLSMLPRRNEEIQARRHWPDPADEDEPDFLDSLLPAGLDLSGRDDSPTAQKEQATSQYGAKPYAAPDQSRVGNFMAPQTGFPNPWLWPTDAAVQGAGFTVALQPVTTAAQKRAFPQDLPMKVVAGHPPAPAPAPAIETEEEVRAAQNAMKQLGVEQHEFGQCRWHKSAETVGVISSDGHIFTKTAGPRRCRMSERGARVELASICMVFDSSLQCGGVHRYCYQIMEGELGAADGAGFVFDSKVRRNNIQRMRSVFLNQRGRICLRNNQQVTKLQAQLPPLTVGVSLTLLVDLDGLNARFNVSNSQGVLAGSADVSLEGLFDPNSSGSQLRSGFFCAVVTGSITIGIH